jgi:hypothetical protein
MSIVVVGLLITDGRVGLLEEDFVWTERLSRALYVLDVTNQSGLCYTSFTLVSSKPTRNLLLRSDHLLLHRRHLQDA